MLTAFSLQGCLKSRNAKMARKKQSYSWASRSWKYHLWETEVKEGEFFFFFFQKATVVKESGLIAPKDKALEGT